MTRAASVRPCCAIALGLLAAACAQSIHAAPALVHDPFSGPALQAPIRQASPAPTAAVAEPPPWNPTLIAVMEAGTRSMVNLDGVIVGIGQEMDGYRLLKVGYREAIFTKGQRRIVLKMDAPVSQPNMDRTIK